MINWKKIMLSDFFDYLTSERNTKFLHWNMRDGNYGFQAIKHRMRVLNPEASNIYDVPESQKYDLARILKDVYGPVYVGDPRMQKLLEKNEMVPQDFLPGQKEANAFENQLYTELYLSSLSKAKAIAEIARLAHNRKLKTNTNMWQMHGGKARALLNWCLDHKTGTILSIIGLIVTVFVAIQYN